MDFRQLELARTHGERSGHFVAPLACSACGIILLGYVSTRARYCYGCRRDMRARLPPDDLAGVPAALMAWGARLRAEGQPSCAADVESEARCVAQELDDLREHWADPDGASCAHCGAPSSKRDKRADALCPVCEHFLASGGPDPDYSEVVQQRPEDAEAANE
jgi:hypothetical protein